MPAAIVIYRHAGLADAAFVALLRERLQALFPAPVSVRETDFSYSEGPRSRRNQYDAIPVIEGFHRAHGAELPAGTFAYLLIADDIGREPYNYLFAFSYGNEGTRDHLSVVSLSRLGDRTTSLPASTRAVRTAERVFKLIAKNVARHAGFTGSNGCMLGFARSIEELDLVPPTFCAEDADALLRAGIIRP